MRWTSWLFLMEDYLVDRLLRSRAFHGTVRRVHKTVHDIKHGRDPNEPLREGEATRETSRGFLSHFVDELRSQARETMGTRRPKD
ncbi:hypothetical protein GGR53DRAFT_498177 [Hypoxylon sp. FL1150]|nr:hypothetical protein GGR53DRAFT_498177 [Hypoxylon sp. FL1150]